MNISEFIKQAQDMQQKMQQLQAEAVKTEVIGESGAGLVQVVMNGRHDVRKVNLDPSLLSEEKGFLEDLLAAAVNDAVR
uniref:YbaB/EbfC family nucleoid-associated protein n=1 Tax=Porticoccus sp. TaxID=2024853 RepID=UPI003F69D896